VARFICCSHCGHGPRVRLAHLAPCVACPPGVNGAARLDDPPRRTLTVYFEPRDVWVGYYRGDTHHYVCPLPMLVVRWPRRRR